MPPRSPPSSSPVAGPLRINLVIPAETNEVRAALLDLRARLSRRAVPEPQIATLELVLAEVLNNIVEHAYAGHQEGTIALRLRGIGAALSCRVLDRGRAMPGGDLPSAEYPVLDRQSVPDLPEGGFGWALINSLTRGLSYERRHDCNRLSFRIEPED